MKANDEQEAPEFFTRAGKINAIREDSYREASDPAADAEGYRFEITFSSEEPYERSFGFEVLGHGPGEAALEWLNSGRAPLLLEHDRAQQIGVIEEAWIENQRGRAVVRFGSGALAQDIRRDVIDGIRGSVSVGYRVDKMRLSEKGADGGADTYRVTAWTPMESSICSIPADSTVGVGRAPEVEVINKTDTSEGIEKMENKDMRERELKAAGASAVAEDRQRRMELLDLANAHKDKLTGVRDYADTLSASGGSVAELQSWILAEYSRGNAQGLVANSAAEANIGLSEKEIKSFSFMKAIRHMDPSVNESADFELECSRAVEKELGKTSSGFFVPNDVLQHRDLAISGGSGANVGGTDLDSGNFIDLLRTKMILDDLGVPMLTGLVGDIAIPKQSAASTAYWVAESAAITESEGTLTQVTGSPKTVGAVVDISRKLLKQSSVDAEALVRGDIAATLARGIQVAYFNGSGSSGEPTGLVSVSGVNNPTVTTDAPTWAQVIDFPAQIMTDNADVDQMKWAMTAEVWGELAGTEKSSSTGVYLLDPQSKTVAGFGYEVSNDVPANHLLFGAWSQCVLAMWGTLELQVNPFVHSDTGIIRVRGLQDVAVLCRHGDAVAFNAAVTS